MGIGERRGGGVARTSAYSRANEAKSGEATVVGRKGERWTLGGEGDTADAELGAMGERGAGVRVVDSEPAGVSSAQATVAAASTATAVGLPVGEDPWGQDQGPRPWVVSWVVSSRWSPRHAPRGPSDGASCDGREDQSACLTKRGRPASCALQHDGGRCRASAGQT